MLQKSLENLISGHDKHILGSAHSFRESAGKYSNKPSQFGNNQ